LIFPGALYLMESLGMSISAIAYLLLVFLLISICVIFHEYGHALAAKYYGIKTDDIILSPFFGVARIRKLPERPLGEFMVAAAGPFVNLLLGLFFYLFLHFSDSSFLPVFFDELYQAVINSGKRVSSLPNNYSNIHLTIAILILTNIALVVFNLIPAFPMDGGRMFRAILHKFTNKISATKIASFVGQIISIIIALISIYYGQYTMALVAAFIYYMAIGEYKMVKEELFRKQFLVKDIMRNSFTLLNQFSTKSKIENLFLNSFEKDFLVINSNEKIEGILIKNNIIKWLSRKDDLFENNILQFIISEFPSIHIEMKIEEVLDVMQHSNIRFLPVMDNEKLLGVISEKEIYTFLNLKKRLQS